MFVIPAKAGISKKQVSCPCLPTGRFAGMTEKI